MLNQSFKQVLVPKVGTALLAAGQTTDVLADGQLAIVDANSYVAVTAPTYATNKALQLVLGTPDASALPLLAGIPKTNQYTKLIKGKLLKKITRRTPHAGQGEIWTIGYDGTDTTKSIRAKVGETQQVFIKATGNPIDKLYSNQGYQRQYWIGVQDCDDCATDSCADADPTVLAQQLVDAINNDKKWSNGSGQLLVATLLSGTDAGGKTVAGVQIVSAFVNKITNDCTYDYFPYEADVIHLEIGVENENYDASSCQTFFPVTKVQDLIYPTGVGAAVREQEKKSLGYFLRERSVDPAVREAEGFSFNTDVTQTYIQYDLHFDFHYKVLGWSQNYVDAYIVTVYLVNGSALATAFQTAVTGYATSVGSQVDQELN